MKFLNDAAVAESPDRTGGIIQIRGADGKLRNYKGYTGKRTEQNPNLASRHWTRW